MKAIQAFVFYCGAMALAIITIGGMLAPVLPVADIVNHFRPWIVLSCIALLAIAPTRANGKVFALALVILNSVLMGIPIAANGFAQTPALATSMEPEFSLLSLNVLARNETPEKVVEFLSTESADIVLLQEMSARMRDAILPQLQKL